MNDSTSETKDPICGMTVDEATALHAERDGKTFYFCSDHCRDKFRGKRGQPHFAVPRSGDFAKFHDRLFFAPVAELTPHWDRDWAAIAASLYTGGKLRRNRRLAHFGA